MCTRDECECRSHAIKRGRMPANTRVPGGAGAACLLLAGASLPSHLVGRRDGTRQRAAMPKQRQQGE